MVIDLSACKAADITVSSVTVADKNGKNTITAGAKNQFVYAAPATAKAIITVEFAASKTVTNWDINGETCENRGSLNSYKLDGYYLRAALLGQ